DEGPREPNIGGDESWASPILDMMPRNPRARQGWTARETRTPTLESR
ncbi:MAG: hypothetical protein RL112_1607, partial [Planctomycetota bacterium]